MVTSVTSKCRVVRWLINEAFRLVAAKTNEQMFSFSVLGLAVSKQVPSKSPEKLWAGFLEMMKNKGNFGLEDFL